MDQNMYLDILKQNLKQRAEKFGLQRSFKFYQDNDPKHKAQRIKIQLVYNCTKVLETPPQSPDLNVIENLWSHIKIAIKKHEISKKNQLKVVLREQWSKISSEYCKKLVRSMPDRLKDVIRNKGLPTKYQAVQKAKYFFFICVRVLF